MVKKLEFIESEWVSLTQLEFAPWNYKKDDDGQAGKLRSSIERTGCCVDLNIAQRKEAPEDFQYEVIDGNHRLQVYKDIGVKRILCKLHGRLSKVDRMRVGVELNEHKFEPNIVKLADCMAKISEQFGLDDLKSTMPFTEGEIKAYGNLSRGEVVDEERTKDREDKKHKREEDTVIYTVTESQDKEIRKSIRTKQRQQALGLGGALHAICKEWLG